MDVVRQLLECGFKTVGDDQSDERSLDDAEFMKILDKGIKQESDGFYSLPLPFRGGKPPVFPKN